MMVSRHGYRVLCPLACTVIHSGAIKSDVTQTSTGERYVGIHARTFLSLARSLSFSFSPFFLSSPLFLSRSVSPRSPFSFLRAQLFARMRVCARDSKMPARRRKHTGASGLSRESTSSRRDSEKKKGCEFLRKGTFTNSRHRSGARASPEGFFFF